MFLQLHDSYESDGYVVSYPGTPQYSATKQLQPYNPYSHAGQAATKYAVRLPQLGQGEGCYVADGNVRKAYVLEGKNAWKDAVGQAGKALDAYKKFQDPGVVGSKIVTNPDGTQSSVPVTKAERLLRIAGVVLEIFGALKGGIDAAAATRLSETAAEIYDSNKYGLMSLCTMSVPQLKMYAQKAYNDVDYWSGYVQAPGKTAGEKRIGNRNLVCSARALEFLVGQMEKKGVPFVPGQGSAPQAAGGLLPLAAIGILASLIRF